SKKIRDGLTHELVIIDDYYDGLLVVTFVHRPTLGNETQKISPGSPGKAQRRPPCDSMIERQIDSPIPIPSSFVVKKASKIFSKFSASAPGPLSAIVTKTSWPSLTLVFNSRTRRSLLEEFIASIALHTKLRKTCSN